MNVFPYSNAGRPAPPVDLVKVNGELFEQSSLSSTLTLLPFHTDITMKHLSLPVVTRFPGVATNEPSALYEIDKVVGAEFLVHAGVHSTDDKISQKKTAI